MCESLEVHERRAECANGTGPRARTAAGGGLWASLFVLLALLLGLSALGAFDAHYVSRENRPSDAELRSNFLSHQAAFDELVKILDTDNQSLAANGTTAIDLSAMAGPGTSAARTRVHTLLRRISVADFRYFPDSGKLILVPDGQESLQRPSKSYLYLPHARSQPFAQYHGYDWRGPGIYIVTGDRPLKGSWFIHHDMTMEMVGLSY